MAKQQIRILSLELDKDDSSIVYKLQKNWTLQFRLGTSLLGQTVFLHTNYPIEDGRFSRIKYYNLGWKSDSNNKADDTSLYANIHIEISGSFHFYLTYARYVEL